MSVRSFLALTGLGVYGVSLYGSYRWFRITSGGMHGPCGCPAGGGAQWDTLSDSYDREVGLDETLMGLRLLRWWLVSHAQARWPPPACTASAHASAIRYAGGLKALTGTVCIGIKMF